MAPHVLSLCRIGLCDLLLNQSTCHPHERPVTRRDPVGSRRPVTREAWRENAGKTLGTVVPFGVERSFVSGNDGTQGNHGRTMLAASA